MLFSQRHGLEPVKTTIQVDSMDDDLRNGLWNCLVLFLLEPIEGSHTTRSTIISHLRDQGKVFIRKLWHNFFKQPIDTIPDDYPKVRAYIRNYYFGGSCRNVYDLVQWIAENHFDENLSNRFMTACNVVLEKELSGYRFVDDMIVRITSDEEIVAVEEAVKIPDPFKGPRTQIRAALKKLADRKSPDYRGSIKESMSAVEGTLTITKGKP